MNKKFSTLMASLLLAGGMYSTASAETLANAVSKFGEGQYVRVYVNAGGSIAGISDFSEQKYGMLDSEAAVGYVMTAESDKSDLWTVVAVSGANGTIAGYKLVNVKTGAALSQKVDDKTYDTFATNATTQLTWANVSNKGYYVGAEVAKGWYYNVQKVNPSALTKEELEDKNGDSFSIQIGYQETKDGKLVWNEYTTFEGGNVFAGKLYVGEENTLGTATQYALYTDAARTKRIVLTKDNWNGSTAALGSGNIFKVLTKAEYDAEVKKGEESNILADEFIVSVPADTKGEPIEVVATDGTNKYELVVSVVKNAEGKNVNRLTVATDVTSNAADYATANADGNTYVKFGASNVADPTKVLTKDSFYTITEIAEDGNFVLAASSCSGTKYNFVEEVANKLEAQWALSYENGEYTVTNREDNTISFTLVENAVRENDNTTDNIYIVNGKTYKIEAVATTEKDGYKWLGDVENQRYAIAHWSGVYNAKAWITSDEKGNVVLKTGDVSEVASELKEVSASVDTVFVINTFKYYNNGWKDAADTLKVPVYAFADMGGNDFKLGTNKTYIFDSAATAKAQLLTIRESGDKYNLRLAQKSGETASFVNTLIDAGDSKTGMLENKTCIYDTNDGQLFVVESLNRPIYRRLGATVEDGLKDMDLNNVKFNRTNDVNTFLYENSANRNANNGEAVLNFLGETNLANQPAGSSLAIFVDTAYVRNNTTEPLYLLSVRNNFVEGTDSIPCPDHGYDPNCPHWVAGTPDYREGAYLVTLTDSASIDQAKYQGSTRLAFVNAKHVGDSLIIESSKYTGTELAAKDTLSFADKKGVQLENAATFSFRLVDPADESGDFYIETVGGNYVRIHNSVPVLVSDLDLAATFNVSATEDQATANENIAAGNVVVAGVNGAVVVKGAEGKNVIVSTILGKVVANEVVSSDNATIAAPAGVVVVSVDGESFKVVVK